MCQYTPRRRGGYPIPGLGGGGTPSQVWVGGGTPSQVWVGGYPIPGLGEGGYPIPGLGGGYPIPGLGGGVPHPRSEWGGTPSQVWVGGYPILGLGERGTPSQVWMVGGVTPPPLARSGWGNPPPPPPWLMGYIPTPHQHSEHLLCSGRYASCVHEGGLSCSLSCYWKMCHKIKYGPIYIQRLRRRSQISSVLVLYCYTKHLPLQPAVVGGIALWAIQERRCSRRVAVARCKRALIQNRREKDAMW